MYRPNFFREARNSSFFLIVRVFLFFALSSTSSYAGFSDCAIDWNLFNNPTGFVSAYTSRGQIIRDTEARNGMSDPSHGPANVPPDGTDLASGAVSGNNPGPYATTFFGYYDGGTPYDRNNPSTMNDDVIFFRVRVAGDPTTSSKTDFTNYDWNILLDVDADGYKEYWIDLEGNYSQKDSAGNYYDRLSILYDNSNNQGISNPDAAGVRVNYFGAYNTKDTGSSCQFGRSHTRAYPVNDGTGEWYVEEQVPMTAFKDNHGNQVLFPDSPVAFVWSTGASNQDPLQKDWMMDLTGGLISWTDADPIVFGDIVIPDGQPIARFTDSAITFKDFYTIGDKIYVYVKDPLANTNDNTIQQIQVTVSDPATGDDEVLTLTETGPSTGIFSNAGGTGLSTLQSDGMLNNSDNSGSIEVSSGDTIYVTYTNLKAITVVDQASVVGSCQAFIQFTRANGLPSNQFILTNSTGTSDQLYVTVSSPWANTNVNTQQSLTVNLTGNDRYTMTLTETGNNTGVFTNTTGLQTEIQVNFPANTTDTIWEDNDGGVVTATYTYTCGGQQRTASTTAQLFVTASAGRVNFINGAGTQDVSIYTPGQPAFVRVVDSTVNNSQTGCTWPGTVTVTSSSGDSETIPLTQTGAGSGVYMNRTNDLVTTAGSAIVTSASSNFNTLGVQVGGLFVIATGPDMGTYAVANVNSATQLTLNKTLSSSGTGIGFTAKPLITGTYTGSNTINNGLLTAADGDTLTVTYHDCNDGDSISTNDNKIDTATFNTPPVLINEVLFWPDPNTCQTEYIELYNASTQPVDVTGYRVTDGDQFTYTIPQFNGSDILLGTGKKIYISIYDIVPANKYDSATGTYYLFAPEAARTGTFPSDELGDPAASNLADAADQISLYNASNVIIDYVAWSSSNTPSSDFISDFAASVSSGIWQDGAYVSTVGMGIGEAIKRVTDGFDTNSPGDWVFTGTSTVCQTIITRAAISSFDARIENGRTVVSWETASEAGTAGFNLLRLDRQTGRYKRINRRLLPALIVSPQGGSYSLVDKGASPDGSDLYMLIEIEGSGMQNAYGPFTAGKQPGGRHVPHPGGLLTLTTTDGLYTVSGAYRKVTGAGALSAPSDEVTDFVRVARKGTVVRAASANPAVKTSISVQGATSATSAKLVVNEDGLYYLGSSDIAALLGISPADASTLIQNNGISLSTMGKQVAYMPLQDFSGIYFYGSKIHSPYTDDNVYWLRKTTGTRMRAAAGYTASAGSADASFLESAHFEQDIFTAAAYFTDPTADYWFWDYVVAGDPTYGTKSFTLHTDGVSSDTGNATITIDLMGATNSPSNPHHARFFLNGNDADHLIGESSWEGIETQEVTLSFSQSLLKEGDNTLTVTGVLDCDNPDCYSIFYVNFFDLSYHRLYAASGNKLLFRADANPVVTVGGFTSSGIMLFDVTNPLRPIRVSRKIGMQNGAYRISFIPSSGNALYLAITKGSVLQVPKSFMDNPTRLKTRGNYADYLIITTPELKDAAQTLANYRQGAGLASMVVLQDDIMDEFNYGVYDPNAVKSFLTYVYHYWRKVPRYLLIAGNGTYDYKNIMGYGDNLVPPIMVGTPDGIFSSDNHFADVMGDHVPRMAVGRLPVRTAQEMRDSVSKIIGYETGSGGSWQQQLIFAADYPENDGNFPAESDDLAAILPQTYGLQKIYLSDYPIDEARSLLLNAINGGAALLNYKGHGGPDRFSQDGLLLASDVASMTNAYSLPFVAAMTCMAGKFDEPGYDTIAKALVMKPGGGAIAVWTPTGMSKDSLANVLNGDFLDLTFGSGQKVIGSALMEVFRDYMEAGNDSWLIDIFALLGDPALKLK